MSTKIKIKEINTGRTATLTVEYAAGLAEVRVFDFVAQISQEQGIPFNAVRLCRHDKDGKIDEAAGLDDYNKMMSDTLDPDDDADVVKYFVVQTLRTFEDLSMKDLVKADQDAKDDATKQAKDDEELKKKESDKKKKEEITKRMTK